MKLPLSLIAALLLVVPACKGKDDAPATGANPPPAAGKPAPRCAAGELIAGDACVAVVTASTVAAVQQQGDRIDALAKVLDDVSAVAGPIELLKAFRDLEVWKQMVAVVPELAKAEAVIDTLDQGVKQLAGFRGSLGEVRTRLGAIGKELQSVYETTGTQQRVAEVRTRISAEVAAATQTLDVAAQRLIEQVVTPALGQLKDVADIVDGACAIGKLKGGGADFLKLCGQAQAVFGPAQAYLQGLRSQPRTLVRDVTAALEVELAALLDPATKAGLDAVQARVDGLLQTP